VRGAGTCVSRNGYQSAPPNVMLPGDRVVAREQKRKALLRVTYLPSAGFRLTQISRPVLLVFVLKVSHIAYWPNGAQSVRFRSLQAGREKVFWSH